MTEHEIDMITSDAEEFYQSRVDLLVGVEVVCPFCDGTGEGDDDCPYCHGSGVGSPVGPSKCSACRGKGYLSSVPECAECDGSGVALIDVTEWQRLMLEVAGELRGE